MPRPESDGTTIGIIAFGPVASRATGYHVRTHHVAELLSDCCDEVIVFEFPESVEADRASRDYTTVRLGNDGGRNEDEQNEDEWNDDERNEGGRNDDEPSDDEPGVFEEYLTFDAVGAIKFQLESASALWDVKSELAECDLVLVGGALIPAGIVLSKLTGTKTVLDTHCINKRLAEGYRHRNFAAYVARRTLWDALERFASNVTDEVVTVSETEARFVADEYGVDSSHVHVIQNVVELPDTETDPKRVRALRREFGLDGKRVATFVGALDSVQNRDAVEFLVGEIAPSVRDQGADLDTVFLVIGTGDEQWTDSPENVRFTGYVEDLGPYMALSDVCIAPLRVGAGTKTKVLDYMAYDEPVLTTEKGAEGLSIDDLAGVEVTSPESFAERLSNLEDVFEGYRGGNRAFVSDNYTPESIRADLRKLVGVGDEASERREVERV